MQAAARLISAAWRSEIIKSIIQHQAAENKTLGINNHRQSMASFRGGTLTKRACTDAVARRWRRWRKSGASKEHQHQNGAHAMVQSKYRNSAAQAIKSLVAELRPTTMSGRRCGCGGAGEMRRDLWQARRQNRASGADAYQIRQLNQPVSPDITPVRRRYRVCRK